MHVHDDMLLSEDPVEQDLPLSLLVGLLCWSMYARKN